ncbi:VOC family protein [Tropicimonas marinistellae]|uniref:VOC family protein n=1 Tax=Tropicimonas marinistellae TaxID=1739787 RepID=UPI00082EC3B2|nr:VOC family protein [Tropicimonas marinistellae]
MAGQVLGVGGLFFRAKDPGALAEWYETHLGVTRAPTDMTTPPWVSTEGVTVFAPFAEDTTYFPEERAFMVNFRVSDLDDLLARLAEAGIEASQRDDLPGVGRFARIHDPEGNPVELWEPEAAP